MPEERDQSRGGAGGPIFVSLLVLVLLPAFYVLSCGPAFALMTRGYFSEDVFHAIYLPLSLSAQLSPWLGRLLESYAQLWAA